MGLMLLYDQKLKKSRSVKYLLAAGHGELEGAEPLFQLGHDHALNDRVVQNRHVLQLLR